MQPKTSIELGINKAISTDSRLCLDLAQKIITLKACTHTIYHSGMSKTTYTTLSQLVLSVVFLYCFVGDQLFLSV